MDESSSPPLRGDAELIGAIASGDTAAYATLQERHAAAARVLARRLVKSPAEAEEVITETFARLHAVLRRGDGPAAAMRPYLLTTVRRVAAERSGGPRAEPGASAARPATGEAGARADEADTVVLGAPLGDLATTELESEPMARAFGSLPERQRAVLWHTAIEQADPAQAATVLGVTVDGVAEAGEQARAALSRTYLKLYLSGTTREDCRSAARKLDVHVSRPARRPNEGKVQRHLRRCRDCRAVAVELAGLSRSLRRTVAPVVLGPATQAYLAAVEARPASPGPAAAAAAATAWAAGGLRWMRQAPRRIRQAPRQQHALAAGGFLLATFAVVGLGLTLAASTGPRGPAGQRPPAAAAGSPNPAAVAPIPLPTTGGSAPAAAPTSAPSAAPASMAPLVPAAASSPAPSPMPMPGRHHHRHHHHHGDPGQASAQ
jgi:DNA-directed RNA polymerase specialized sigma24 family protein